jgi:hypothetical protein
VQQTLEEVLRDKERELKLYQRFLDLRHFCDETLWPLTDLPLKQHVEDLKHLIEKIIPDAKDRTEELFSGEIFALLGAIYLHDIGSIKNYEWNAGKKILTDFDSADKRILANHGIGERLGIPETAIEIINYLTFSDVLKKVPIEWEITEEGKKAIVRNTKLIGGLFNFAHLLLDVFYSDLKYPEISRFSERTCVLRKAAAKVDVDSKNGVISIHYNAEFPHELHVLSKAKTYVEDAFDLFKNNVNGKLAFGYRELTWDVTRNFGYQKDFLEVPKFSAYGEHEGPPLERWEKASLIIDTAFSLGYAIVVGSLATGKTTVLRSFTIPQLLSISPNVFYCELWEKPANEIKDIIIKRFPDVGGPDTDIVSLCKKLLDQGPCFFILDNCERYPYLEPNEKEKLERFITFCLEQDNIYLIVSGDKEAFFKWYVPFSRMNISGLCEVKPIEGGKAIDAYGEEKVPWDRGERYMPMECELLQANRSLEEVLEGVLEKEKDQDDFRKIVAVLFDWSDGPLMRHTLESIHVETDLPHKTILDRLNLLKQKDIVKEFESTGQAYYALSSRHLKGALYKVLKLEDFEEKRRLRTVLRNSLINDTFLDDLALTILEKWKDELVFSKEEAGLILASLIAQSGDTQAIFEKVKRDGKGTDIQPILKLLHLADPIKRRKAVQLLVEIQDKNMINPLLAHLKREDVFEIRNLVVEGIGLIGKKRTILAIMDTLKEIGDRQLKLRAIEFFYSLLDGNVGNVLGEIKEREEDPIVLAKIDGLLALIKEGT